MRWRRSTTGDNDKRGLFHGKWPFVYFIYTKKKTSANDPLWVLIMAEKGHIISVKNDLAKR